MAATTRLSSKERRLVVVLAVNLAIVAGEVVAGLVAGSLGLVADAAHNLTDVAGLALALVAVRWARRAPTERRSFGYHRGQVLAAQANAALILAATAVVALEAVRRLTDTGHVDGGVVAVVAGIALVANAGSALLLREGGNDVNMRAAVLHMGADAGASAGVLLAGLLIAATGGYQWADPAVSLVIGVVIGWQAIKLVGETTSMLLESTPHGVDLDEVVRAMRAVAGVEDVHDLHVWSLSGDVHALSAHVILDGHPTLEEAQVVGTAVKAAVSAPFAISHATLELECEGCVDDGAWCSMNDVDAEHASHVGHHH